MQFALERDICRPVSLMVARFYRRPHLRIPICYKDRKVQRRTTESGSDQPGNRVILHKADLIVTLVVSDDQSARS